jgi:hypothetical protein
VSLPDKDNDHQHPKYAGGGAVLFLMLLIFAVGFAVILWLGDPMSDLESCLAYPPHASQVGTPGWVDHCVERVYGPHGIR